MSRENIMLLFKDALRWSLPLIWSAIAAAVFFTLHVVGNPATVLMPLGWAALTLACLTTAMNAMWSN